MRKTPPTGTRTRGVLTALWMQTPARSQLQQHQRQDGSRHAPAEEARTRSHLLLKHRTQVSRAARHLSPFRIFLLIAKLLGTLKIKPYRHTHTQGFKNLTAVVLVSEHIPLMHMRFNCTLKFYRLQWDVRICLTFIMCLSVFSQQIGFPAQEL